MGSLLDLARAQVCGERVGGAVDLLPRTVLLANRGGRLLRPPAEDRSQDRGATKRAQ